MQTPDPSTNPATNPATDRLEDLRASIDNLDAAIVHLLAERFKCTQEVGRLKAREQMPPSDPARERTQIARLRRLAEESSLDPVFAERFLAFIIEEVIHHHESIAREGHAGAGASGDTGQRPPR